MEELEKKFKRERKELQAKIQALKKSATKGDKKRKKEVQEEIALLEADLDRRHQEEEENFREALPVNDGELSELNCSVESQEGDVSAPQPRVTKAEKRRQKKVAASKERDARIQEQEDVNLLGPRHKEMVAIVEKLRDRGLSIYTIVADGNCLYSALEHQLKEASGECSDLDCKSLRKLTANHLRQNPDEFLPFLSNQDTGDPLSEKEFETYCHKVESTTAWGGQIELRALSNELKYPIEVIQATGPPLIIGEEFMSTRKPLIVTFHRYMYRLGEHYNSVTPFVEEDQEL